MVYLLFAMSLFCAFVAFKTRERDVRIAFVLFCAFNALAVIVALATSDPYAFKFLPGDPADNEAIYRR